MIRLGVIFLIALGRSYIYNPDDGQNYRANMSIEEDGSLPRCPCPPERSLRSIAIR